MNRSRRRRSRGAGGLRPVGDAVARWAGAVGLDASIRVGVGDPLRWTDLVGDDIAAACAPTSLVDGVLTVESADDIGATLVRYSEAAIIAVCNEACGTEAVRRIKVVRRPPGP